MFILGNISPVNVDTPDLQKYPNFAKAKYTETIVGPGEMLFIPRGCWHFVASLTVSFSVSFWFQSNTTQAKKTRAKQETQAQTQTTQTTTTTQQQ